MGLETGTYIDSLNASNPVGASDPKSEGDDHIRLIKSTVKNTFPNLTGAVNTTQSELNTLDGITSTTAELNILDGVTATTAEINVLDDSAAAITDYQGGVRFYVHDEIASATLLDIDASLTATTWTSIGPSGAGATVTWAALDVIPANSSYIIIGVRNSISGSSSGTYQQLLYARNNGSALGAIARTQISEVQFTNTSAGAEIMAIAGQVTIPIDSNGIFELYRAAVGTSPTIDLTGTLIGFG